MQTAPKPVWKLSSSDRHPVARHSALGRTFKNCYSSCKIHQNILKLSLMHLHNILINEYAVGCDVTWPLKWDKQIFCSISDFLQKFQIFCRNFRFFANISDFLLATSLLWWHGKDVTGRWHGCDVILMILLSYFSKLAWIID